MNDWAMFDEWRARYDTDTLQQQKDFHAFVYQQWSEQHGHSDDGPVDEFFDMALHAMPAQVLEIGGWTGDAAARILPRHANITGWLNIEICEPAVNNPATQDVRYSAASPDVWPWESQWSGYNVLFMQHVVEHMRFAEFKRLVQACPDVEWVFIQSPLEREGRDWLGYPGCHIIEAGWDALDEFMVSEGFSIVKSWWDSATADSPENGRTTIYRRAL